MKEKIKLALWNKVKSTYPSGKSKHTIALLEDDFESFIEEVVKIYDISNVSSSYIVFEDGYKEGIEGMIQLTNKFNTLEDAQRYAKDCKQNTYIAKMV